MDEQLIVDFFKEEKFHWWHINKRKLLQQHINGKKLNILVLGIGGGLICSELETLGHKVYGVDISRVACVYGHKELRISTLVCDLEKPIPFKNNFFDYAIASDVIEHLINDKPLVSEIYKSLKPGGITLITVPAFMHMWSTWDDRLEHKRRYTLGQLRNLISINGFSDEKSSYINMLLYPLVLMYRKLVSPLKSKVKQQASSDFSASSNPLFSLFFNPYFIVERKLMFFFNLPFGLSVFIKAKKNG